ncbi:MAG: photosynthetic protein synthase I [Marinobacter sp.]|nr:photosynthetic protein synthase I [Marinobacter sp.]|tara:strand:- start:397 stop:1452 length:1056 start_codon:yes stop_codon:yes gene_type:complete
MAAATLAAETVSPGTPLQAPEINPVKAELGKRLFYDARLSGDTSTACASCHQPEHGFSHPDALSPGYRGNGHFRNSPTLINAALKKIWMHDGRLGTNLNDVTREMITETYLMNMDMRLMQERLKQDPVYVQMFKDAYGAEPSNGLVRKAIPEFLKTLVSRNSDFDKGTLSASAERGFELFKGKGGCAQCHSGPLFSDGQAHNTGVPENFDVFLEPERYQAFLAYNKFMGNENIMNIKRDLGAHVQSHKADGSDIGKFMTPALRELTYTAPYMHNGTLKSLPEVVAFYNAGGGEDARKSGLLEPLGLSVREQNDLVNFLESLSGDPLNGADFVPENKEYSYQPITDWRKTAN